jgi:hypothetical protein
MMPHICTYINSEYILSVSPGISGHAFILVRSSIHPQTTKQEEIQGQKLCLSCLARKGQRRFFMKKNVDYYLKEN